MIALGIGLISFAIGYYVYSSKLDRERILEERRSHQAEDIEKSNNEENVLNTDGKEIDTDQEVTQYGYTIEEDTKIIFRTLYTQCQTVEEEVQNPVEEFIGLTEIGLEKYIEANHLKWDIIRFTKGEVILLEKKEQMCPNHFLVSVKDGYIAVYQYNEEGEKVLVEKTSIPISILPSVDQQKLNRGILLNTRKEVNQLLEDYSS